MKKTIFAIILIFVVFDAQAVCKGPIMDPISRVRWNCLLPITIAGIPWGTSGYPLADKMDRNAGVGTQSPICLCTDPIPRAGITLGYREPIRIIESVKDPFCYPSLGFGMSATAWGGGAKSTNKGKNAGVDFSNTHMYIFPVFKMLSLFTDLVCMQSEPKNFSMAYTSEVDPSKKSDVLALLLTPEALLFANPVAVMACQIPDSIATLVEYTIPPLDWCAGNHSIFPLSNNVVSQGNYVESAEVNASKLIFSMHRTAQLWGSLGNQGLCGIYPMPIWNKMQYRLQTAMPVPDYYCRRLGMPSIAWNHGKNPPGAPNNDNLAFILWRKRDCCAF
jgi:conjugal transfer pilus assembly protein TraU